jgi:hypothetical protein
VRRAYDGFVAGSGLSMSYMGYYFYPDAVASIKDSPNGAKPNRPRWFKILLFVARLAILTLLVLFLL